MLSHITAKDVGDPFWATVFKTVALCYRTVVCLSVTSVCYGLTVGWIMMPLGTEVGLGLGDIVLDGDSLPQGGGHSTPNFGPCLLWSNGWMDQDETWNGGRPLPRRHRVRWGPSPLPQRDTAPNFRPMSVVAKRLDGSRCYLVWR